MTSQLSSIDPCNSWSVVVVVDDGVVGVVVVVVGLNIFYIHIYITYAKVSNTSTNNVQGSHLI